MMSVNIPLALAAGILSFLSPCVLPLVPVYLGYLSGSTLQTGEDTSRWRVLSQAVAFVFGFSLVFVVGLGLPTTLLGQGLHRYSGFIAKVGGAFLIILGLHTLGVLRIPILNMALHIDPGRRLRPGYVRSLLLGVALAVTWTPCIGPLLGTVLTLAFTEPQRGLLLLSVYALGLALPFLLAATLLTQAMAWFRRLRKLMPLIEVTSGLLLIGVGVLLLTGKLALLNAYLARITPEWLLL